MAYCIRNTQTDRLELHFDHPFYKALPASIKDAIRENYRWNKSRSAWESRNKLSDPDGVFLPEIEGLEDQGSGVPDDTQPPAPDRAKSSSAAPAGKGTKKDNPADGIGFVATQTGPPLSDDAYVKTYFEVWHLLDEQSRQAHAYFDAETDNFEHLANLYSDGAILDAWQAHKQHISDVNASRPKVNPHLDGYTQGRGFVGRHMKQTADMDIADLAKLVRAELAATFPDCKFSVTIDRYSMGQSMDVKLLNVPFNPFNDDFKEYMKERTDADAALGFSRWYQTKHNHSNHYRSPFTSQLEGIVEKAKKIQNQYNFDNSDPMTDYFHVRYYGQVNVDETSLMAQFYPNSSEVLRSQQHNQKWAERKKVADAKAAESRGTFPRGAVVYYTRSSGRPDRKGYLNDGKYLAQVVKSPNGRARFGGSYELFLLAPLSTLSPEKQDKLRQYQREKRPKELDIIILVNGEEYTRDSSYRLLESIMEPSLSAVEGITATRPGMIRPDTPKYAPAPAPPKSAPAPKPAGVPAPRPSLPAAADPAAQAAPYLKQAERYQNEGEKLSAQLEGAKNNTPKRNREYNSKRITSDSILDKAAYMKAIGQAILAGTLPRILSGIRPTGAANDLYLFVPLQANGGGYYDAIRDSEPPFKSRSSLDSKGNLSGFALKKAAEIGLHTLEQVEQAWIALKELSKQAGHAGADPKKAQLEQAINKWRFSNQPGFFPTPKDLGGRIIDLAGIEPGDSILEPEAGLGDLAEILRERYPNNPLDVVEKMHSLGEILKLKGFNLVGDDFLETSKTYDRIVMNPPFEKNQDIDHVRHAFDLLNPGGRLVAIMGAGALFGGIKKRQDFKDWFEDEVGGVVESLPAGSFKDSFRQTGVNSIVVVIDKPGTARKPVSTAAASTGGVSTAAVSTGAQPSARARALAIALAEQKILAYQLKFL